MIQYLNIKTTTREQQYIHNIKYMFIFITISHVFAVALSKTNGRELDTYIVLSFVQSHKRNKSDNWSKL